MAKRQPREDDKGRVKIRFMEVELEGSNEALLEGIRSITSAIPSAQVTTTRRLPSRNLNPYPQVTDEEMDVDSEDEDVESDESVQTAPAPKRPRAPRAAAKAPPLSGNLRLDEAPMPITEFIGSLKLDKNSSEMDKALAVAVWLKEHRQQDGMSAGDFYTCCKFMDWSPPTDLTSPMRNLKRDQKLDSPERGKFRVTIIGEKHFRDLRK